MLYNWRLVKHRIWLHLSKQNHQEENLRKIQFKTENTEDCIYEREKLILCMIGPTHGAYL